MRSSKRDEKLMGCDHALGMEDERYAIYISGAL